MPEREDMGQSVVNFQEVAVLLGMTPGVLRRRLNAEAFGWKSERVAAGLTEDQMALSEVVRAGAWQHFEESGCKPDGRTKYYLNNQRFEMQHLVIVCRNDRSVFCVGIETALESLAIPGLYSVYDPTEHMAQLGIAWVE